MIKLNFLDIMDFDQLHKYDNAYRGLKKKRPLCHSPHGGGEVKDCAFRHHSSESSKEMIEKVGSEICYSEE